MKKIMVCTLSIMTLICVLLSASFGTPNIKANAATKNYGLTVANDGTIMLDGKPFYGFGTNLFDLFNMNLTNPLDADFEQKLALVKKYNIPFVRVAFSGYDYKSYTLYDQNPEAYFFFMDQVVDAAEKYQIGIIASLMWWDPALPQYVKEKRSDFGNNSSKTIAFAKKYVSDIVKRYKDRPGIWGWEIGNEYNLTADLCDKNFKNYLWAYSSDNGNQVNGYDYYTSTELVNFYKEISKTIRSIDPYRMISSGNGDMRGASYAMHMATLPEKIANSNPPHTWNIDWTTDTLDQFYYMNAFYTPSPMDTISFHLQHGQEDFDKLTIKRWKRTITEGEYFKEFKNAAKKAKKGLFLGEMGDFIDYENRPELPQKFDQILKWVDEAEIQIAATWQFYFDGGKQVVSDQGNDGMKLRKLQEYNLKYKNEGKQDTSKAWIDVKKPTTTQNTTTKTSNRTAANTPTTSRVQNQISSPNTTGNTGETSETTVSDALKELSKYMVSRSTKLSLDADNNIINITRTMTYDLFTRSIALKSGYSIKVLDSEGSEITDSNKTVDDKCIVKVFDPEGKEIRSFSINVNPTESTTPNTTRDASEPGEKEGLSTPILILIIVAAVLVLSGGGFSIYYFLIKKNKKSLS